MMRVCGLARRHVATTARVGVQCRPLSRLATMRAVEEKPKFRPELVIFDKDGTLIDFSYMWGQWAHALCSAVEHHLPGNVDVFEQAIGYDRKTKTVATDSPLCCSPMSEIEARCASVLVKNGGMDPEEAARVLRSVWSMPDPRTDTKELTDLVSLFESLKESNVRVAVCTTDNRDETEATLEYLGVEGLVDAVLCGDDKHVLPKPSREQIDFICQEVGVPVSNTIMVGDTITDMKMGQSAGVGLCIGIPNGAGSTEDLFATADVVLPSMHNFQRVFSTII